MEFKGQILTSWLFALMPGLSDSIQILRTYQYQEMFIFEVISMTLNLLLSFSGFQKCAGNLSLFPTQLLRSPSVKWGRHSLCLQPKERYRLCSTYSFLLTYSVDNYILPGILSFFLPKKIIWAEIRNAHFSLSLSIHQFSSVNKAQIYHATKSCL